MKSQLRSLADGGSPRPEMLGTGAAARAGGLLAGRGRQVDDAVDAATGTPAPAPVPAPAPAPAPQQVSQAPKKSGLRGLLGLADGGTYLDDAYNTNVYQQSQLKDGGRVKGPGGRTDDKVGPVMLSDEEYVLPGDTADAIGRDKLDAIRLATHDFKDERKESALRGRADGGDGWYDDMMPMDHLADGGAAWTVDSKGTVRPNAFGDAAAGPGYQQPRLPPPQPGTAVGPSAISPGAAGPRTINMGMVDEVPRTAPQQLRAPTAPTAPAAAPMGPVSNPNVGPNGSREAQAFRNAAGNSFGDAVAAAKDPSLVSRAGGALRTAGNVLAKGAGVVGAGMAAKDMYDNGVNVGNSGDLLASGAAFAGPVGVAAAGGWGAGRAISGSLSEDTRDMIGGVINQGVRNVGNFFGQDWGVDDSALLQQKAAARQAGANTPAAAPAAASPTSALRSDQGPALPVEPGSYQSRRLSEMGVPLDVQNSKPIVGADLRTAGTDQYQNLGTYGGNGNIYGKADDPSRPGRINNFVGVGAGASPSNEANGSGWVSPQTRSPLRTESASAPMPPQFQGGNAAREINARYDKMLQNGRGRSVEFGSDWSQRHGAKIEADRNSALADAARDDTARANAQLNAATTLETNRASTEASRENAALQARTSLLVQAAQMERARAAADIDAKKYADGRQDKGAAHTEKLIEQAFTSNVDGKDVVDRGSIAQLNEFLGSGKVMYNGRPFMSLNPQERAAALPDVINSFRVNKAINEGGGMVGGGRTTNSPSPLRVREAELGDLANGLEIGEYLGSKFMPGYDANVVERTGDRKVRSVEKVAGDDLERRKAILRNLATGS